MVGVSLLVPRYQEGSASEEEIDQACTRVPRPRAGLLCCIATGVESESLSLSPTSWFTWPPLQLLPRRFGAEPSRAEPSRGRPL